MNLPSKQVFILVCIFLLSGFVHSIHAQDDVIVGARAAIKGSDVKKLAAYFNESVEINLNDDKASYTKDKAEMVLLDFFKKYPIKDFRYIHQGASKQGMLYAIGKYEHQNGAFRVYMLVKDVSGKQKIDMIDFGEE